MLWSMVQFVRLHMNFEAYRGKKRPNAIILVPNYGLKAVAGYLVKLHQYSPDQPHMPGY